MLSQQIDNYLAGLVERCEAIDAGQAGPIVLDQAGIIKLAEMLDAWCDQAMALEGAMIAPTARITAHDLVDGKVIQLRDRMPPLSGARA